MAIVTLPFAEFANGQVLVTFDYNDGNGNVTKLHIDNQSAYAIKFTVYERTDAEGTEVQRFVLTVPANTLKDQNVAGTTLAWDTVDGGLMMGPYRFEAQWPA